MLEAAVREILQEGLAALPGREPTDAQLDALAELALLTAAWGERINLTSHRGPDQVAKRLIVDAAALYCALPPARALCDIGSGAGFPGLPIAILNPQVRVTLVEAREKRHYFQRTARRSLGLENVVLLRGRVEDLEPLPHPGVVAQAVARPDVVLEWALAWAQEGGFIAIPGGGSPPEVAPHPRVTRSRLVPYGKTLATPRTLWIGEVARTP